jgi:hypothetical protein
LFAAERIKFLINIGTRNLVIRLLTAGCQAVSMYTPRQYNSLTEPVEPRLNEQIALYSIDTETGADPLSTGPVHNLPD